MARFVELGHVLEGNSPLLDSRGHLATCLHAPFSPLRGRTRSEPDPARRCRGHPRDGRLTRPLSRVRSHSSSTGKLSRIERSSSARDGTIAGGRPDTGSPGRIFKPRSLDLLVGGGAALVGVDFWNIDDAADLASQARTRLSASRSTRRRAPLQPPRASRGKGSVSSPSRSASPAEPPFQCGRSPSSASGNGSSRRPPRAESAAVIAMLRETWWWPWWVSSLIDLAIVFAALARLPPQRAPC